MTLTVEQLRGFVATDLGDTELDTLLDAAYEAIDEVAGASGAITEIVRSSGDLFMLARPASAVSTVVELRLGGDLTLATDDWQLVGGQMVRRLSTGTNPSSRWCARTSVTYTPATDTNERDRVAIALVKLDATAAPGLQSQRVGEWSETYDTGNDYATERAAILASLHSGFAAF